MNDSISRQWLMECVNEGWIKFDTEKDENRFVHLVRDIAPSEQPSVSKTEIVGDVISRQTAIDAFAPYAEYESNRTNAEWVRRINMVLSALPSAQPGWIPCDRELPKPNEEDGNGFYKAYLVQDGRWMDVARWDGKYWIAWGYSTVLLNVVAWMLLPTPYHSEGEKE